MKLAFELPAPQAEKLRAEAKRLGLSPEDLARAALTDLLATPDAEFQAVAARVVAKNRNSTAAWPDAISDARRGRGLAERSLKAPAERRGFETWPHWSPPSHNHAQRSTE
jgi:hypothetical protein